jgi:hypothetical protein
MNYLKKTVWKMVMMSTEIQRRLQRLALVSCVALAQLATDRASAMQAGTVIAWGPVPSYLTPPVLTNAVAVTVGLDHCLALTGSGTNGA